MSISIDSYSVCSQFNLLTANILQLSLPSTPKNLYPSIPTLSFPFPSSFLFSLVATMVLSHKDSHGYSLHSSYPSNQLSF